MPDRDGPRSNPYHLNPAKACEACVFGSGEHAAWCKTRPVGMTCWEFCCAAPATDAETGWCEEHLRMAKALGAWTRLSSTPATGDTSDVTHASS